MSLNSYTRNAEQQRARQREYYQRHQEWHIERSRIWSLENPERVRERKRRRSALKSQAIPPWYEKELVTRIYEASGEWGLEVDHVVPLRSDLVCGLHSWSNLQLLATEENISKGNRHWPDMPDEPAP